MSSENRLFRKAALERLSSPDQLDQMMEVTTPKGWIALWTVGVILIAAIIWGFLGNLPSKVEGQGILIRGGTVLDVVSGFSGRIEDVLVQSGDLVEVGQVVARVSQAPLETRIANLRIQLNSFQEQDQSLREIEDRNRALEQNVIDEQLASIDETIKNLQQQAAFLEERIKSQEEIATAGLITRAAVLETRSAFFGVLQEIARARASQQDIEVQRLNTDKLIQQERNHRHLQIEQTRLELEEMEAELARSTEIIARSSGRVLQVMLDRGNMVHEGQSVLTMELTDPPLTLIAFIPPEDGKKVLLGMSVNITPSTVKPEEHGHMLGTVVNVSSFPSTPQGMMRILRNESLVKQMSALGSPIEVTVAPVLDPNTPSGFEWSSRRGPDQEIVAGTLAYASVVVEQRKPITMVLPLLRRWFLGVESPGRS